MTRRDQTARQPAPSAFSYRLDSFCTKEDLWSSLVSGDAASAQACLPLDSRLHSLCTSCFQSHSISGEFQLEMPCNGSRYSSVHLSAVWPHMTVLMILLQKQDTLQGQAQRTTAYSTSDLSNVRSSVEVCCSTGCSHFFPSRSGPVSALVQLLAFQWKQ